jgi:cystathionine beta-lyase
MKYNFDNYPEADRSNFVRYNPVFLKTIFGRTDALPFWVADTDFLAMPELVQALEDRAKTGLFGYETKSPSLKKSLSKWYEDRYKIKLHPKKLLFMPSVNSSIAAIIDEFTIPGEGVIIQPPVYQAFKGIIESLEREVINNPLVLSDNQYEIDFDDLEQKAQSPSAKIFLLCSPHNPVGRVWGEDELRKISQICAENELLLITDEIHGDIVYEPSKYIGMLNIHKEFGTNIIMVSSAGKTFGMPGLVDSFIFTPNHDYHGGLKKRIERFHLDKSNAFANTAWQVVYEHGHDWLEQMTAYLKGNVDYISDYLENNLDAVQLPMPEGTYQIWLDFRNLNLSNEELARFLAEEAGIALNQGYTYGPGGDGFMRMNIASPRKMIVQAMEQLKEAHDKRFG